MPVSLKQQSIGVYSDAEVKETGFPKLSNCPTVQPQCEDAAFCMSDQHDQPPVSCLPAHFNSCLVLKLKDRLSHSCKFGMFALRIASSVS